MTRENGGQVAECVCKFEDQVCIYCGAPDPSVEWLIFCHPDVAKQLSEMPDKTEAPLYGTERINGS